MDKRDKAYLKRLPIVETDRGHARVIGSKLDDDFWRVQLLYEGEVIVYHISQLRRIE